MFLIGGACFDKLLTNTLSFYYCCCLFHLRFFRTTISAVDVTAIEVDKSSFGYSKIKALTQDVTSALACGKPKNGLVAITFIIAVLALGRSIAGLIF